MEDFAQLIEPLARHFFGEPNRRLSSKAELRFGKHGSLSVDLKKGTWFDHEAMAGGGALDLVKRQNSFTETREAMAWLEAGGWRPSRGNGNGHDKSRARRVELAHYDYVDEAGELLLQVVRYEPKDFRQRKPDGRGGWVWSAKDVRPVPYHLPELLETLASEHPVFVVEGEKDADNLRRIGVPATCNAMGAGKWPSEINPIFAGADVIIIADNDPQQTDKAGKPLFHEDGRPKHAGQDHANAVAAELSTAAARVRVLDLGKAWQGCPEKGDISDWIEAGGDAALLYQTVETLADWKPFAPSARRPTPYIAPDPATMPRRAWLHGGHYIRQAATATVAPGGMGKTTLTLFEAITMIAAGLNVWYLSGEDPRVEIDRRIAAHCQHHNIEIAALPGRLFVDDRATFAMFIGTSARTASVTFDDPSLAMFEGAIRGDSIDVVLIDPFVSFHSVPENDNGAIDQVVKRLAQIAQRTNCCIEISHHVRKPFQGQATLTVDDARGGSAIINAVRSGRAINRMTSNEAEQAKIDKDRRSFYFRVDKGKRNMAPPEAADWYQMYSIHLPNGDNVQAIEPWQFPKLFAGMSPEDEEWARDLVNRKAYKVDPRSEDWLGIPIAQRLQLDVHDQGDCKRIAKIIGTWVLNRVFKKMEMRDPIARRMKPYYVGMDAKSATPAKAPELPLDDEEDDNDD